LWTRTNRLVCREWAELGLSLRHLEHFLVGYRYRSATALPQPWRKPRDLANVAGVIFRALKSSGVLPVAAELPWAPSIWQEVSVESIRYTSRKV